MKIRPNHKKAQLREEQQSMTVHPRAGRGIQYFSTICNREYLQYRIARQALGCTTWLPNFKQLIRGTLSL